MAFTIPTLDELHTLLVALLKSLFPDLDVSRTSFPALFARVLAAAATDNHALLVASLADLEKACQDDKVAGLDGFGAKTQEKLLHALATLKQGAGRHLASVAAHASATLLDDLRAFEGG